MTLPIPGGLGDRELRSLADYQKALGTWALDCFGPAVVANKAERAKRVVEEAIELGQASGLTADDCRDLVAYVFGRPIGDPSQEVAGTFVTTLVLCETYGIDAQAALHKEFERVHQPEIFEKIRRKQVSKEIAGIGMSEGVPAQSKQRSCGPHNPQENKQ